MTKLVNIAQTVYLRIAVVLGLAFFTLSLAAQKEDKLDVGGFVRADMNLFYSDAAEPRQDPFRWRISATPRFRYGKWRIETLLNIGSYEDRLGQAFNKLGVTSRYDWATIYLGHRTMSFSPLVLSNHLFFGAGVQLRPGKFRFSAMYGKFKRAVKSDSLDLSFIPSFSRIGYGVSIGAGRPQNYVDVHFFRAMDDTTSLNYIPDYASKTPEQNFVAGLSINQRFVKRVYLKLDAAASAYSYDIRSDDVEVGEEFWGDDFAYQLFQPRYSSQYLGAIKGELEYRHKDMAFGIGYDLIEPDYQSMGTYFFQNDVERYRVNGRWKMFDKKLGVSINLAQEQNNLKENKTTETTRRRVNTGVNFQPNKQTSFILNYSGYQTLQTGLNTEGLKADLVNQFTNSLMLNGNHRMENQDRVGGSLTFLNRANGLTGSSDFLSYGGRLNYTRNVGDNGFSFTPEFGYSAFQFGGSTQSSRLSPGISATKNIKDLNLSISAGSVFVMARVDGSSTSNTTRSNVRLSYTLMKKHRFNAQVYESSTFYSGGGEYTEVSGTIGYVYSF